MVSFWPAAVPFFWHLLLSASAAELASTFFDATMEPPEPDYQMWDSGADSAADPNTTIHIAGRGQVVAPGTQAWKNSSGALLGSALFYVLPKLLSRKEVKRLRDLVQDDPFDVDTDSVDGQWTHELYLESNGSFDNAARFTGKADALSPEVAAKRKALRKRVGAITQKIVRERVAPLVRARYPRLCGRSAARACSTCVRGEPSGRDQECESGSSRLRERGDGLLLGFTACIDIRVSPPRRPTWPALHVARRRRCGESPAALPPPAGRGSLCCFRRVS